MLLFVVAIGYLCFGVADAPQRTILALPCAVVAASGAWEVSVHWQNSLMEKWGEYHIR